MHGVPTILAEGAAEEKMKKSFFTATIAKYTIVIIQNSVFLLKIFLVFSLSLNNRQKKNLCFPKLLEVHSHLKRGEASTVPLNFL